MSAIESLPARWTSFTESRCRPRLHRSQRALLAVSIFGLGLLFSAAWIGWIGRAQPWHRATGWAALPLQDRPPSTAGWPDLGPDFRLHWLGHAGFRIQWAGKTLLFDPNLSRVCTVVPRRLLLPETVGDLGSPDAVLISHAHFDHLDLPTLRNLPTLGKLVVPAGAGSYLESLPVEVVELPVGDRTQVGPLEIFAVEAAHNGHRLHPFGSKKQAVGYVVRRIDEPERALYVAGDTGFGPPDGRLFAQIRDLYAPELAVLPIGAFSPRWLLHPYHLSPEEAVRAGKILGAEVVLPSHFGTFTLSWDRPSWALPRFAREARRQGLAWRMPVLWQGSSDSAEAPVHDRS